MDYGNRQEIQIFLSAVAETEVSTQAQQHETEVSTEAQQHEDSSDHTSETPTHCYLHKQ